MDDYMAEGRVETESDENGEKLELKLYGRKKEKDVEQKGKLHVFVKSSHDLQALWIMPRQLRQSHGDIFTDIFRS